MVLEKGSDYFGTHNINLHGPKKLRRSVFIAQYEQIL